MLADLLCRPPDRWTPRALSREAPCSLWTVQEQDWKAKRTVFDIQFWLFATIRVTEVRVIFHNDGINSTNQQLHSSLKKWKNGAFLSMPDCRIVIIISSKYTKTESAWYPITTVARRTARRAHQSEECVRTVPAMQYTFYDGESLANRRSQSSIRSSYLQSYRIYIGYFWLEANCSRLAIFMRYVATHHPRESPASPTIEGLMHG